MTVREQTPARPPDEALRRELERREDDLQRPLDRLRFVRASVEAYDSAPRTARALAPRRVCARMAVARAGARLGRRGGFGDRFLRAGYAGAGVVDALGGAVSGRTLAGALALAAVMAGIAAAPSMWRRWRPAEILPPPAPTALAVARAREVWLVESGDAGELYSNGLRVSNEFLTHHRPRRYPWLPPSLGAEGLAALEDPDWRSLPAGIVYHTTVSDTAPLLERRNNQLLRSHGELLLRYMARQKLYNFVIDRFGRVYRLIPEDETAYHAGFSIWADDQAAFIDLNEIFLGVAFETRPEAVDPGVSPEAAVTEAQLDAARRLTRMLRERYGIPAADCITHEMVSVNPDRRLLGYHSDWAGRFPFEAIGLPDNYEALVPAVSYWGFRYDGEFLAKLGGRPPSGLRESEKRFRREARERGVSADQLRRARAREYHALRQRLNAVRKSDPGAMRSH